MSDPMSEDDESFERFECPHCGKPFDVVPGSQWSDEGLICPHCGIEIED